METVYSMLNETTRNDPLTSHISLLESPTGTGKSLALIGGVFTWMTNLNDTSVDRLGEKDEFDWVNEWASSEIQNPATPLLPISKSTKTTHNSQVHADILRDLEMKDSSRDWRRIMYDEQNTAEVLSVPNQVKVIYASRTHSQVSQFVREISKTSFSHIQGVSLASRKQLCINKSVLLKGANGVDDSCRMLMDAKKKASKKTKRDRAGKGIVVNSTTCDPECGCPYFKENPHANSEFRQSVFKEILDVERLRELGVEHGLCPYFGARALINDARVIALPYSSLLHKSTRLSLGIDLTNTVVIIDEAHNLVDTVSQLYSSSLQLTQAEIVLSRLVLYISKYTKRMNPVNILLVKRSIYILKRIVKFFTKLKETNPADTTLILSVNDWLVELSIDNQNLFELDQYFESSHVLLKIKGLSSDPDPADSSYVAAARNFRAFLLSLTNADKNGRIISRVSHIMGHTICSSRFLMLNSSIHIREICQEARAVILTGGTMKPFDLYKQQLFGKSSDKHLILSTRSFDHVISPKQVLALSLSTGPSGKTTFNFSFQHRDSVGQIIELGKVFVNLSRLVAGGIVCFFPSFSYLERVFGIWQTDSNIYERLNSFKLVFKEPRETSELDVVLSKYSASVRSSGGAILACVVGAKMSEGINFSDDLARCVIMVGLPFPDRRDPELLEKLAYIDGNSSDSSHKDSDDYYLALCMRAVNQSIGRAIRHKNDYASIILIDHRYSSSKISSQIPDWIRSRLKVTPSFGICIKELVQFYRTMNPPISIQK